MLDRNLDAYRIVAEILAALRSEVHKRLAKRHGEDWYRTGLPEGVLARLIERKEKEKTIDWYDSEYQQLIDFATFSELLEILVAEPDLVPGITKLAPNVPLLHARLLELDVLREKLALARPISDNELSFLGTFYLRFRQAAQEAERPTGADDEEPVPGGEGPDEIDAEPEKDGKKKKKGKAADEVDEVAAEDKPKPVKPVEPPPDVAAERAAKATESDDMAAAAGEDAEAEEQDRETAAAALDEAVKNEDTTAILRSLYREVIDIAEGLWTSEIPSEPEAWETVRSSDWYARNFSSLGLQPLSDFYQVVESVREMMDDGLARNQVQDHLKDHNFAAVLLSLRDMFQKHEI